MPHLKPLKSTRRLPAPIHIRIANMTAELTLAHRIQKRRHFGLFTLRDQLHATVVEVSHVSRHFKSTRNLTRRVSKSDPLHPSRVKHRRTLAHKTRPRD